MRHHITAEEVEAVQKAAAVVLASAADEYGSTKSLVWHPSRVDHPLAVRWKETTTAGTVVSEGEERFQREEHAVEKYNRHLP